MSGVLVPKPMFGRQLRIGHPFTRGLVACWLMNEGRGIKILDVSGNRYNFDFTNSPIWTPGKFGPSILFDDASSQYLSRSGVCGITDWPVTFVCWFNSNDTGANQCLMAFGDADSEPLVELRLRDTPDTDIIARCDSIGDLASFAQTTAQWKANTWHLAAGVFVSDTLRYAYLDDIDFGSDTGSVNFDATFDNTRIGAQTYNNVTQYYMSGKVGLAMIWNRALSTSEIARLYREPFCMFRDNP